MIGYKLQENYIKNLEALLMKKQSHVASSSATLLIVEPVTPTPSTTLVMAKTLRDYSTTAVGLIVNIGDGSFELHTGLIMME